MFRIVFDPDAPLRGLGVSDVITGAIYFELDDGKFWLPDRRWVDRVHPNVGLWIEQCRRLVDGEIGEALLRFSEGPFAVALELLSETDIQFRCMYGGARQYPMFFSGPFVEVIDEFERVSSAIDRACADNGFVAERLEPRAAELKRRFELNGAKLRIAPV